MMEQYSRIKQLHRDAVLFFRLGDFYEMFLQDAKEASALLGLTLTKRNGVPMCGIPYHASRGYIARLLKAGKKIAVCEQLRLPEGGKGLADREVVEILSPGTVVDEDYLDRGSNNYLASLAAWKDGLSLSAVDVSTGDLVTTRIPAEASLEGLRREMSRLAPREMLVQESLLAGNEGIARFVNDGKGIVVNTLPDWSFDRKVSYERLRKLLGVANLKGFGISEEDPELLSAGVLVEYLEENAKGVLSHIRSIRKYRESDFLSLDESALRNLELVRNIHDGSSAFTLLQALDHTKTAMGSRLLKKWMLQPLVDRDAILARQNAVAALYHDQERLVGLRNLLAEVYDLERLVARVALDKAHGKDLLSIRCTLEEAVKIRSVLADEKFAGLSRIDDSAAGALRDLGEMLGRAIAESPSILLTEGGLIRDGFDEELDGLRSVQANRRQVLESYLDEERRASGIGNLRIRYNKIIGYYLEVTKAQTSLVPSHFIRRQSLVNGERYSTERLAELESLLNNASEKIVELEKKLFLEVRDRVKARIAEITETSRFLAEADTMQALAQAATVHGYTRPAISTGGGIRIVEGRHPVVEMHLPHGDFVPNSLDLDGKEKSFALITGPNMAGKSTYLRQAALIVVMAQMGSFVPALEAEIGIVDRIYCRVGAQDNLARGESTFLVEMNETANILRTATKDSLVIMDEVGRGTSTNDGLAIAWAVTEDLLDRLGAKTLFATHFHELTALEHPKLKNLSMDIREDKGTVIFLKRVKDGPSNNSYGIHVAKLAGLPEKVLLRAEEILEGLVERKERPVRKRHPGEASPARKPAVQRTLFSYSEILEREIREFPIERSTPLDALNFLSRWKTIIGGDSGNE